MTLAEVLPAVRQLTAPEKLKLIRILAEDLEGNEDISPLEHGKVYDLPTPYDSFGAAQILANAKEEIKETAYLLRSPKNARRLLASVAELETGGGTKRELTD